MAEHVIREAEQQLLNLFLVRGTFGIDLNLGSNQIGGEVFLQPLDIPVLTHCAGVIRTSAEMMVKRQAEISKVAGRKNIPEEAFQVFHFLFVACCSSALFRSPRRDAARNQR